MKSRRCLMVPLLLAVLAGTARAQGRTVTGTVTDSSSGSPIRGVTVSVQGAVQSAETRDNGGFVLAHVPDQDVTLVFRLIGYRRGQVQVAAGEAGPVTIALARDPFKLEEVVVTGQFTGQERRQLANAVATVNSDDLDQTPTPSIEHQLQGKVAGADIQTNSGAPGGGVQVRLRGITSINAPAEPLYVVDGVIMSDVAIPSNQNAVTGASQGSNPTVNQDAQVNRIADLNPADIERVEVLKGAAASSIYGVRASNGVVIITTKTGKSGRPQVNLTQRFGFFSESNKIGERRFANAADVDAAFPVKSGPLTSAISGCDASSCPFFDHEQELAGNKPLSFETLGSVSGGDDNTHYYASGTVKRDGGIIQNTGFDRQGVRINVDQKLGSRVKLSLNTNVLHTKASRGLTNNDNTTTSYYVVYAFTPSFVDLTQNPDGSFKNNTFVPSNPLQTAALSTNDEDVWRYISGANADFQLIQSQRHSLRLIANGGLDFFNQKNALFFPPELQFEPNDGLPGTSLLTHANNTNLNLFGTLVHTFTGGGFNATTSAGVQHSRRDLDISRVTSRNLVGGQSNVNAAVNIAVDQKRQLIKNLGYFLQEEVLIKDRLLLTAGVRADQSSANHDATELFWYPKGAASYRLPGLLGSGSDFKLRAAYGESGNEPEYGQIFTELAPTLNVGGFPGLVVSTGATTGAADLRPEHMREFEAGFDGSLANGKLNFEVTGYQKKVSDLLLQRNLPQSSGFNQEILNGGSLRTRGLEAALGIQPIDHKNLAVLFRTTFALSRSKITQLDIPSFTQGGFGTSIGTFKFEPDSSPTRIVGNDTLTAPLTLPDGTVLPVGSSVVRKVGETNPDFRMGFSGDVTAHRVGLHFLFDWQKGSDILNLTKLLYDLGSVAPDFADPIAGSTTTVGQQRLAGFGKVTGNYVETASFLKLREVTLSYELPVSSGRRLFGARSARISLSARNLFTVSDYTGLDPEVSNFGNQAVFRNIDVAPFPPSRSFWLSIDLGL
jgi:TonB-dependent starch-binding outer membrane protein SusC